MPLHNVTPLIESVPLGMCCGKRVFLKMENAQAAGSFKIRGIGKLCEDYVSKGCANLVCPSGGNAGYATAWAARALGVKATIIMPESAPQEAREAIAVLGAEVIIYGADWYASNELAETIAQAPHAEYVSSYEHPLIWSGHSTMVDEIVMQWPLAEKPGAVLLSIGGGGMMSGVIQGLDRHGWGDIPVVGCGTYGANAFAASMAAGKLVRLAEVTSMVTCISAAEVTNQVMAYRKDHTLLSYLTSDYDAMCACERFLDDQRVLVDPSCGVTLSAVYADAPVLKGFDPLLVIVCGGVGVKSRKLERWKEEAKKRWEECGK